MTEMVLLSSLASQLGTQKAGRCSKELGSAVNGHQLSAAHLGVFRVTLRCYTCNVAMNRRQGKASGCHFS